MQAVLANEQHDILHEHADVGPLVLSHVPVDRKEKSQGRTEKIVILGKLRQPRRPVVSRHIDHPVQVFAAFEAARTIRFLEVGRIDIVFAALPVGLDLQFSGDQRLEFAQALATQHMDVPGLKIAPRWRPPRAIQYRADHLDRYRLTGECAATPAGIDCFGDVQVTSSPWLAVIRRSTRYARLSAQAREWRN